MSDQRRLLFILATLILLYVPASANQSATVTVAFSVYVAPTEEPAHTFNLTSDPSSTPDHCEQLLAGTGKPDVRTCQSEQTVYTWQEQGGGTLLTIAPI